jgi:hypothetical protein
MAQSGLLLPLAGEGGAEGVGWGEPYAPAQAAPPSTGFAGPPPPQAGEER